MPVHKQDFIKQDPKRPYRYTVNQLAYDRAVEREKLEIEEKRQAKAAAKKAQKDKKDREEAEVRRKADEHKAYISNADRTASYSLSNQASGSRAAIRAGNEIAAGERRKRELESELRYATDDRRRKELRKELEQANQYLNFVRNDRSNSINIRNFG